MPAPEIIRQLVEKFEENYAAYHSGKYNEAQLRQEFIDKFFEALGWDVYNKNGVAPDYRDVVVEDSLEIEGSSKAPDYAFKIGKERKFYVEAKKPRVDIQYDIHPAYQLKRYAWNAHLPLSILTDFEELAVYNCKNKPNPSDSAATGRDLYFRYTEYVDRWDEIAAIFSKDAVWKGSFDRFAESSKGKKGTTGVDDAILDDIENWRKLLALNIALRNPQVADEHQLNYAVQMTIDRILFLRICEDRGIEPEEQLKNISKTAGIYPQLVELFRRADLKFNSGLFHFNKEKGNDGTPDTFTPGLKIDDRVLKEIISSIYYPCPYIFKEIPVEILGQVYEQFLGKVVRLTAGHQARIEEKPEVRKAGGVYYTPKYIVDYIVQNTVGKLLEGKTPAEAADLKIVDPACGSGSFLLGAFQHLIDWHEQWYNENQPEKWARGKNPAVLPSSGGGWRLTTTKKKEILVNNIYGVDIDAQAVEVTKLSLLLKVLEEESGQLSLGLERALPDLGKNIRCGNSLIGPDYYEGRQMPMFGDAELYRVNPFDWKAAFPQVFASETPAKTAVIKPALPPELLNRCRELRKNETDAERLLWALLRDRQLNGLKFRRQHPLGGYILDFYCHEELLAVELDGSGHLDDAQVRHDEQRTKDLEALGVRVLRFWNHEVLSNPQGALLAILAAVEDSHPSPLANGEKDPHPSPLPKGEGGPLPVPYRSVSRGGGGAQGSGLSSSPNGRGARGEGGFDAVIGNPPYIRIQALKEWAPQEVEFYKKRYQSASKGNYDIYVVFVEKGLSLLNEKGRLGYILPHKFFNAQYGQPLRGLIAEGKHLAKVVHFSAQQVFKGATTYTCLLILNKHSTHEFEFEKVIDLISWKEGKSGEKGLKDNSPVSSSEWNFSVGEGSVLTEKINKYPCRLGDIAEIFVGLQTSADDVYIMELISETKDTLVLRSSELKKEFELEKGIIYPLVSGTDVNRYKDLPERQYIIFPYSLVGNKVELIEFKTIQKQYPRLASYLLVNKKKLEDREKGKLKGGKWHGYIYLKNMTRQNIQKICVPRLVDHLYAAYDHNGIHYLDNVDVGGIILRNNYSPHGLLYLLGLLNSKVLRWYFPYVSAPFRGGWLSANRQFLSQLPIRTIDFNDPADVKRHERMVALVESMLALHRQLAAAHTPQETELLQRQIASTDRQIDALVYELYGLTAEEVRIVEGGE